MAKGERIKSLREKRGYSQTELAELTHISKQTLYKYENNIITNIPSDVLERIASVLECTPSYLMGWEDITDANGVEVMAKVPDFVVQLSPDESVLIEAYRKDQSFKDMINRLLIYAGKIGEKDA